MHIDLTGRRALVTGATFSETNSGYVIARALARSGASVVMNGRTAASVENAFSALKAEVPEADLTAAPADLSSAAGVGKLIAHAPDVDIFVHNAGLPEVKPFFDLNEGDWDLHWQVHVMAAVRLSQNYLPAMIAAGWGRILFSASTTGGFRSGEMAHYGTTKTALIGLARGLAETVSGSGVTVNCFLPGPMRERTDEVIEWEKELFSESVLSTSLLERFITPEEVANFVIFLASDQASAITGSALRVDGGIVRSLV